MHVRLVGTAPRASDLEAPAATAARQHGTGELCAGERLSAAGTARVVGVERVVERRRTAAARRPRPLPACRLRAVAGERRRGTTRRRLPRRSPHWGGPTERAGSTWDRLPRAQTPPRRCARSRARACGSRPRSPARAWPPTTGSRRSCPHPQADDVLARARAARPRRRATPGRGAPRRAPPARARRAAADACRAAAAGARSARPRQAAAGSVDALDQPRRGPPRRGRAAPATSSVAVSRSAGSEKPPPARAGRRSGHLLAYVEIVHGSLSPRAPRTSASGPA